MGLTRGDAFLLVQELEKHFSTPASEENDDDDNEVEIIGFGETREEKDARLLEEVCAPLEAQTVGRIP